MKNTPDPIDKILKVCGISGPWEPLQATVPQYESNHIIYACAPTFLATPFQGLKLALSTP